MFALITYISQIIQASTELSEFELCDLPAARYGMTRPVKYARGSGWSYGVLKLKAYWKLANSRELLCSIWLFKGQAVNQIITPFPDVPPNY